MSIKKLLEKAEDMTDAQLMSHSRKHGNCRCGDCLKCICHLVWEIRKSKRLDKLD